MFLLHMDFQFCNRRKEVFGYKVVSKTCSYHKISIFIA